MNKAIEDKLTEIDNEVEALGKVVERMAKGLVDFKVRLDAMETVLDGMQEAIKDLE